MFRRKPQEVSAPPAWLIVGLGNPGPEYARTRHNIGFDIIDALAKGAGISLTQRKHQAVYGSGWLGGIPVVLAKPLTYMNLSGRAVKPLLDAFGLKPDRLLVIADEVDFGPGKLRLRAQGSSGGHNGHKSIIQAVGTSEYPRLRVGVGKGLDTAQHVLSRFTPNEQPIMQEAIERSVQAVHWVLEHGVTIAMNHVNSGPASGDDRS